MKLYNTLTRNIENFKPISKNIVSLYTCGPTVYDSLTIGNWTAYIRWDILARTLILSNYNLKWYMNITDVGHLTSDADDGEDKLEKGAKREGKTAWEVADKYTEDFLDGLNKLNISINRNNLVKATDEIGEQIKLIQKLEEKGCTYKIDDGIYFDSTKFAEYGKMARLDLKGLKAGARVDIRGKKHLSDFAVWKFSPKNSKRDMEWDSPFGGKDRKGFPGWHIECSAIAMKYLGETIDIHGGGIDHIPIHHTNEIAQSETATGKKFVNYWLHSNFLQIDGSKIAKSLGNGYTLHDLESKGFSTKDFRLFVLQSHFQSESNFTWEGLKAAQTRLKELQALADLRFQVLPAYKDQSELLDGVKTNITFYLQGNLNTPKVMAELSRVALSFSSSGINNKNEAEFVQFIEWLDKILGLQLLASTDITPEQNKVIAEREKIRKEKSWQKSDELRESLEKQGIGLNDTPSGTIWYRL